MAGGFAAAAGARLQQELAASPPAAVDNMPANPVGRVAHLVQPVGQENPVMAVMLAPIRLFRHLKAMHEEILEKKNVSEAERLVRGMKFDRYEEHVCAVQYKGIPVVNPHAPEGDPDRFPYVKIVTDICENYRMDQTTKNNLLNAKLCDEASLLNFDIKFNVGEAGIFYYGKFMAVNIGGKIDFCFLFYRLNFKIAPDVIETTHARKFLWFTVDTYKTYERKDVGMDQKQLEDFQNFFRLRIFELLGGEIKALADTEPLDALVGPP